MAVNKTIYAIKICIVYYFNKITNYNEISLLCCLLCDDKSEEVVNFLPHNSQAWGFSPVCIRIWTFRLDDWVNALLHIKQV